MLKKLRVVFGARELAIALLFCFGLPLAADELSKMEAAPAGEFSITGTLANFGYAPVQVHDLEIRGIQMFFLVSHGPTLENSALLITDLYGGTASMRRLETSQLFDLTVSADGMSYAVLFSDRQNKPVLETFSIEGTQLARENLEDNPIRLAYLENQFVAVDSTGVLSGLGRDRSGGLVKTLSISFPGSTSLLSLPNNRIAMVNSGSAEVEMIDATSGSRSRRVLSGGVVAQERARIHSTYGIVSSAENILLAASADSRGWIYFLPTGFNPLRDPAPILVIDQTGREQSVVLCRLPPLPNGRGMVPTAIAVSTSELAFVDDYGRVALFYLAR